MAITITQTTFNTGSMTFGGVQDFLTFLNDFSVVQQYNAINLAAHEEGNVLDITVVEQSPNTFIHTRRVASEAADAELKSAFSSDVFKSLLAQLNWTAERRISYEYN